MMFSGWLNNRRQHQPLPQNEIDDADDDNSDDCDCRSSPRPPISLIPSRRRVGVVFSLLAFSAASLFSLALCSKPAPEARTYVHAFPDFLPDFTRNAILQDVESVQSKAWDWLEHHYNMPMWRRKELMGLIAVIIATGQPNPLLLHGNVQECQLRSHSTFEFKCGNKFGHGQHITSVLLKNNDDISRNNFNNHSLPAEISFLSDHLISLDIRQTFSGPLPSQLGLLTQLTYLALKYNSFTGDIPTQIGQLDKLQTLEFRDRTNSFQGTLPSQLGLLTSLSYLCWRSPYTTGHLPSELGQLSALGQLSIRPTSLLPQDNIGGNLTGPIPSELGQLPTLSSLDLADQQLTGTIPKQLGQMPLLGGIYLRNNQLTGSIPSGEYPQLRSMDIRNNSGLTGTIPARLCGFGVLESFLVDCDRGLECNCHWSNSNATTALSLPTSADFLPAYTLQTISTNPQSPQAKAFHWLQQHPELDTMPTRRKQQLFALASLLPDQQWNPTVHECQWKSLYPTCTESGEYTMLFYIRKPIGGSIPPEVSLLTKLQSINLEESQLTGSIPTTIGQLSSTLQLIRASKNNLSGSLPSQLGQLTLLEDIEVANNNLDGSLPSEFGCLTALQQLWLGDGNHLTGRLPSQLGEITDLNVLDFGNDGSTGTIPSEIGRLTKLGGLELKGNHMTGALPSELAHLSGLMNCNLRGNNFTNTSSWSNVIPYCSF